MEDSRGMVPWESSVLSLYCSRMSLVDADIVVFLKL